MMGRVARTLAVAATMGTRPGKASWVVEVASALVSVVVGGFALMLSIGLVLGGLVACTGEPYRTFGELIRVGYEDGFWLGALTSFFPILLCFLAQVIPWALFRYSTDPILLPVERANVRLVLLAFLPVVPFAVIACGVLAAMNARIPGCDILIASTVPGWIDSPVLDLVLLVSLVVGPAVFAWTIVLGLRRVRVMLAWDENQCPECLYDMVGLARCPECGRERCDVSSD
jgi:hypothetical protein